MTLKELTMISKEKRKLSVFGLVCLAGVFILTKFFAALISLLESSQ